MNNGFLITIRSQPKHGTLYAAAKAAGSVKSLAAEMGCSSASVCNWINLRDYPKSIFRNGHAQRRKRIDSALRQVVGIGLEECWPKELREFIDKTRNLKSLIFEQTEDVPLPRLTTAMERRLTYEADQDRGLKQEEARERINQTLKTLTYREREIVKLRYGINENGVSYTLEEVAHVFKVSRERIRQTESKAIRKLQQPERAEVLRCLLE